MAPAAADHVLEIGCGAGHAVALLSSKCARGTITALDRSALQTAKARALNREAVAAGRVRIETMTLAEAAVALGQSFSKVLAINVNAFWTNPTTSLASLRGLLRPRGRVYLVYDAPTASALEKLRVSVPRELSANGFAVERARLSRAASPPLLGVIARPLPAR